MCHFDDGRDPLRGTKPEHRNCDRVGHRISVQRNDIEGMTWQGKTANFGGASVQYVKQNSLALLDADGFPVVQDPAIDRKGTVTDFVSMRHTFCKGSLHT